jgi:hypothetical protein
MIGDLFIALWQAAIIVWLAKHLAVLVIVAGLNVGAICFGGLGILVIRED